MTHDPYGAPPPPSPFGPSQGPYGAPPPPHQPHGGYGPPHSPYSGRPAPGYPAPPARSGGKTALIVLVSIIGALLVGGLLLAWSLGWFNTRSASPEPDYSISAPGQAPALSEAFLQQGTWREVCGGSGGSMEFRADGKLWVWDPQQGGRPTQTPYHLTANGVQLTRGDAGQLLVLEPLGPKVMRATYDGVARTLRAC